MRNLKKRKFPRLGSFIKFRLWKKEAAIPLPSLQDDPLTLSDQWC